MSESTVRQVRIEDAQEWERLRQALWPSAPGEHRAEIGRFFRGIRDNPAEAFIAYSETGTALGFAEVSLRRDAEGCTPGRIAYLEGWYVDATARGRGIGAALVYAAEEWARSQDCNEIASDTELDNLVSWSAHQALGFEEMTRIICFRKRLE